MGQQDPPIVREGPGRAHRYSGLFNGSNDAERRFLMILPAATQRANQALRRHGSSETMTPSEVAMNFITEGGYFLLDGDITEAINSFQYIGVDNVAGALRVYGPWIGAGLVAHVGNPNNQVAEVNERNIGVKAAGGLTLEQAVMLSAGVYAYFFDRASRFIKRTSGRHAWDSLPPAGRYFWVTAFFNAGEPTAEKLYRKQGIDLFRRRWSRNPGDRNPAYNSTWRMQSLMLLRETIPNVDAELSMHRAGAWRSVRQSPNFLLQSPGSTTSGTSKTDDGLLFFKNQM